MPAKPAERAKGSVGEGEAGKKANVTHHTGGESVSEKCQVTRTSKNLFEKYTHQTSEYFVDVVKDRRMSKNGVEFLIGWRQETELNAYTRVQQVPIDTYPLMWWKQHVEEFPRLDRMVRQCLTVSATSAFPESLFESVGLVQVTYYRRIGKD
jgi:hypothetical protein